MAADEVAWLGEMARELLREYDRVQPTHTLRTFGDVERLWREVVRPELKNFRTMKQIWEWQSPVPEESRWFENWHVPELE